MTNQTSEKSSRTIVLRPPIPTRDWITRDAIRTAAWLGTGVPFGIVVLLWCFQHPYWDWFWVGALFVFPPIHVVVNIIRTATKANRWHFVECMMQSLMFGSVPAAIYIMLVTSSGRSVFHFQGVGYASVLIGIDLAVSIIVYAIVMMWWRWAGGRRVIQDGTLCYECGYCLIGNTSMTCPECGRPFTLQELNRTPDEWSRLAEAGSTNV